MAIKRLYTQILYNSVDITKDVSSELVSLSYSDRSEGGADSVQLVFDDSAGLWAGAWYPQKKDVLSISFGYDNLRVSAGEFEIDEIDIDGPPARIKIKALAAGVSNAIRTNKSFAHEEKTLREIAQTIADQNGFTLQGEILPIRLNRATQNRESDLAFLKRIAGEFGHLFSIRAGVMTFTLMYDIDAATPVEAISKRQVSSYSFSDKLIGTYANAKSTFHNVETRETVEAVEVRSETADGQTVTDESTPDTLEVRTKAETVQQAEAKARASLYRANTGGQTARLSLEGNPALLAGNNVDLEGFGYMSGKYQISASTHNISRSGYITNLELKRVSYVADSRKTEGAQLKETRELKPREI